MKKIKVDWITYYLNTHSPGEGFFYLDYKQDGPVEDSLGTRERSPWSLFCKCDTCMCFDTVESGMKYFKKEALKMQNAWRDVLIYWN